MKFVLINPPWSFEGSIYFGCRDPHFPLELGYAKALLENAGHRAEIVDAQLFELSLGEVRERVKAADPEITVITTAPSYLFWRCAPPELRVPAETVAAVRDVAGCTVIVGPHGSTTPGAVLRKTGADFAVLGECEDVLVNLASLWEQTDSVAYFEGGEFRRNGRLNATDIAKLPALRWEREWVKAHRHHHHRFDEHSEAPGAEVEASRGCPYHCTFCAKENFRNAYRRRPLETILDEIDGLVWQGVRYVYFIDEIFLPWRELLEALAERPVKFGVQTRVDLWSGSMLDLLGGAGCVSLEAGVESISERGRNLLDKQCRLSTDELADRLIRARRTIPFVQANLIEMKTDTAEEIEAFRRRVMEQGVWANRPVPLFPYPGSPEYARLWGPEDDAAWERAHEHYLKRYTEFSDIQDSQPSSLPELEGRICA